MTRALKSTDVFKMRLGTIYYVNSPVSAPRNRDEYLAALGRVTIDGIGRAVSSVEWNLTLAPVRVGESIGLLVK